MFEKDYYDFKCTMGAVYQICRSGSSSNNNNNVLYCNKDTIKNYAMTLYFQFKVIIRTTTDVSGRIV